MSCLPSQAVQTYHAQNAWTQKGGARLEPWREGRQAASPSPAKLLQVGNGTAATNPEQRSAANSVTSPAPSPLLQQLEAEQSLGGGNLSVDFRCAARSS